MNQLFIEFINKVKGHYPTIVFPEGLDERILQAASQLSKEKILRPILIGDEKKISEKINELNLNFNEITTLSPAEYSGFEQLVSSFMECRNRKETEDVARKLLLDVNYFGTMLVHTNQADGLVSGAVHSTGDTVRPALQIIKTKQSIKKTSGIFLMVKNNQKLIFGDCAININPDIHDLAEIAILTAETARTFNIEPKIAMLSFSSKGSAASPETKKLVEAIQIAKEKAPDLIIDGEIQFDAAFVPSVAQKKVPDSPLAGEATIFIFPNLESGNIGYKIAERLGSFEAIGPILQGLNKPVNDLSRGCNAEDVYKLALITAMQTINK